MFGDVRTKALAIGSWGQSTLVLARNEAQVFGDSRLSPTTDNPTTDKMSVALLIGDSRLSPSAISEGVEAKLRDGAIGQASGA